MNPRARAALPPPAALVDPAATWHARRDDLLIALPRALRLVPLLFLTFTSLFLVATLPPSRPPSLRTSTHRLATDPLERLPANASAVPPPPPPYLPPLRLSTHPVPPHSPMRRAYARLAARYLAVFAARGGISRDDYRIPYLRHPRLCHACFLVQVRGGAVYVHDPRAVRAAMSPFRELRMREALYWLTSAVARGVVDDTEIVFSTTDGVVSTCKSHQYRMPDPADPRPLFTLVGCNVSANIPFPMVLADAMRRAGGHRAEGPVLPHWDELVQGLARVRGREVAWVDKVPKAVFRGTVRAPAVVREGETPAEMCDSVGRTGMWHTAMAHVRALKAFDRETGLARRLWPLPWRWFAPNSEPVLDVRVAGVCGKRVYVGGSMPIEDLNFYKYVVHAEGNSFWADRLVVHLFAGSAVLKQATPCGMFFEPLLLPYVHYIPVDFRFRHLVRQTMWARANDREVRRIVENAREFAAEYLSVAGVQTYVDELLVQYTSLLKDRDIRIERDAVRLFP